jgi:DNA-directed RNA polymerase specialized sigma24 family protein
MKEQSLEDFPQLSEDSTDYVLEFELTERNKAIRETVNKMDKPCAPLLIAFYWEGYSMDEIANNLGYSNANSAKTQKNKCMNKLKALFKAS